MLKRRMVGFAALGAAGAAAVVLGWVRCPLAALYHIPCPGCGMTRALVLLATGHPRESLAMNAVAVPAVAVSLAIGAAMFSDPTPDAIGRARAAARLRTRLALGAAIYAAAVALWTLRWFGLFGGPVPV
jgi:hypothetical protein